MNRSLTEARLAVLGALAERERDDFTQGTKLIARVLGVRDVPSLEERLHGGPEAEVERVVTTVFERASLPRADAAERQFDRRRSAAAQPDMFDAVIFGQKRL